ncbi:bifunctional phosphopantothenoylcysteine decarboxylase/phosphopantothenate--cysteine ligase CoaBC [Caryophanon latum]|uniref:Coenzyme A biosynthesis bifunctional protein CoaBC n=1 Tax=Caryophanon latum TaxID=33977 RepID=A0A1C0YWB3_9BACL|nr:bifunctional phosphopantothenoylcysteine decarboxylase/phosphopantothenate--cysteine ligase CoaBC [Caryophanon latum]OCS91451.1 phosphopantothenoylcysteine decarboxylase [Caryophanon latum]
MIGKHILVCVTGGIAVYKAVALVSKLQQAGAVVKVMMTDSARQFVNPLSFQVMSKNDVFFDTFDEKDSSVIAHIDLADWADLIVVAPATANVIGKVANGIADNMVTTTLLAASCPVWMAPAMNVHMYDHPAVVRNIEQLYVDGVRFIEPSEGFLACGYVGKGRMEEPEKIVELVRAQFKPKDQPLAGKKVVVSAGPTRERIDPVRFVTNFSSGKMGYAMAEAARDLGAEVVLVSGPVALKKPAGIRVVDVESAQDMLEAIEAEYDDANIVVKTAAVADYRPKNAATQKVKKKDGDTFMEMERTPDILATIGRKKTHQLLIGFAAETNDVETYAEGKLTRKNADYIVANDVTEVGAGFNADTNTVTLIGHGGYRARFEHMPKTDLAKRLFETILKRAEL